MKPKINHSSLGGVNSKRIFHRDGAKMIHPSGVEYERKDGKWEVVKKP